MNRRRPGTLFLSVAVAATALACGRGAPAKPLIGVSTQGAGAPFASACLAEVERGAESRAQLAVLDSAGDAEAQLGQVASLIKRKAKSLIAFTASEREAAGLIAAAKAKNVPLVLVGSQPRIEDLRSWDKVLFVGHQAAQAGALQGQLLGAAWRAAPGADADRNGAMRLAFVGPVGDEARSSCLEALKAAGIKVEALDAGSPARAEAVAAGDPGSAAEAIKVLAKGGRRAPVVALELGKAAPKPGELASAGLAGAVRADPAAIGSAAADLAYELAFRRKPADAGFALADGKNLYLPCASALAAAGKVSE